MTVHAEVVQVGAYAALLREALQQNMELHDTRTDFITECTAAAAFLTFVSKNSGLMDLETGEYNLDAPLAPLCTRVNALETALVSFITFVYDFVLTVFWGIGAFFTLGNPSVLKSMKVALVYTGLALALTGICLVATVTPKKGLDFGESFLNNARDSASLAKFLQ